MTFPKKHRITVTNPREGRKKGHLQLRGSAEVEEKWSRHNYWNLTENHVGIWPPYSWRPCVISLSLMDDLAWLIPPAVVADFDSVNALVWLCGRTPPLGGWPCPGPGTPLSDI